MINENHGCWQIQRSTPYWYTGRFRNRDRVSVNLGSVISNTESCNTSAMGRKYRLWKYCCITTTTIRLVRSVVFSILLHSVETLSLQKTERRTHLVIEATAPQSGWPIVAVLQIPTGFSSICVTRTSEFPAHIARRENDNLERFLYQGRLRLRKKCSWQIAG